MRSLKIGLVLAGVIALLSVGFAQGKGDMDSQKKAGTMQTTKTTMKKTTMKGQSKMARHHGKMTKKARGHAMASMAKHHGKMAKHHRHHRHMTRKGHKMMKKGEAMEKKGEAMEKKGAKMSKGGMKSKGSMKKKA